MTAIFFVLAIAAALGAMALRRHRRKQVLLAASEQPGATLDNAIWVRSFDEIDDHLRHRWCVCGGILEPQGEGSHDEGGRHLRTARLVCQECEEVTTVHFDTTDLFH